MLQYTSILKSRPYLYLELKKVASMKIQGLDYNDIKNKAMQENIFGLGSEMRKREISSAVINRIKELDGFVLIKIVNGDLQTSKQLNLYSILKTDRLFYEFMKEVYREKMVLKDYVLVDMDFNVFFRKKSEQNKQIAQWQDYTFYKLSQVYKRVLLEAGFIKKSKNKVEIIPQIMEKDVMDHLKEIGDMAYLEIMIGEI